MTNILSVRNLDVSFRATTGIVAAVRDVSFEIQRGQTLCLVGESGSGKSVTCRAILGLTAGNGRVTGGSAEFEGTDLLHLEESALQAIRGRRIAMIFQDPVAALNPIHRIGTQLTETLVLHEGLAAAPARQRAVALMQEVGIPDPERRLRDYPHQLSGGMNQRVMIAMALACRPELLIADEPTTALDVTIQAQILDLMCRLQQARGMSILFVTHDLGVVAEMADTVVVMRQGRVLESGPVKRIFQEPSHPYTQRLLELVPRLDTPVRHYGGAAA